MVAKIKTINETNPCGVKNYVHTPLPWSIIFLNGKMCQIIFISFEIFTAFIYHKSPRNLKCITGRINSLSVMSIYIPQIFTPRLSSPPVQFYKCVIVSPWQVGPENETVLLSFNFFFSCNTIIPVQFVPIFYNLKQDIFYLKEHIQAFDFPLLKIYPWWLYFLGHHEKMFKYIIQD